MEFEYHNSKLSFQKIINKYNKIKRSYEKEKKILELNFSKSLYFSNYELYKETLYKKSKLDIKYIKKIINIFKPILKNKITLFLHGSYSRNLNRWNSDIDLNILYENKYKDEFLITEEFIQVLLYKLFEFPGRDKIHNIMIYYPMYNKKEYKIKENKHCIIWNNNKLNFECRNNYEKIYPLILNSSRSPKDLYKWIIKEKEINEYIFSFKGINIKGQIFIKRMLIDKDKSIINSLKYLEDLKLISINKSKKIISVSSLNKIIKIENTKKINNLLLNLKLFIIKKDGKCPYLNINKILKNKTLKKYISYEIIERLEKDITNYRLSLDRLENLLISLNINFSSRNNEMINIDILNNEFYKMYKITLYENFEIINSLNKRVDEITKILNFYNIKQKI